MHPAEVLKAHNPLNVNTDFLLAANLADPIDQTRSSEVFLTLRLWGHLGFIPGSNYTAALWNVFQGSDRHINSDRQLWLFQAGKHILFVGDRVLIDEHEGCDCRGSIILNTDPSTELMLSALILSRCHDCDGRGIYHRHLRIESKINSEIFTRTACIDVCRLNVIPITVDVDVTGAERKIIIVCNLGLQRYPPVVSWCTISFKRYIRFELRNGDFMFSFRYRDLVGKKMRSIRDVASIIFLCDFPGPQPEVAGSRGKDFKPEDDTIPGLFSLVCHDCFVGNSKLDLVLRVN